MHTYDIKHILSTFLCYHERKQFVNILASTIFAKYIFEILKQLAQASEL